MAAMDAEQLSYTDDTGRVKLLTVDEARRLISELRVNVRQYELRRDILTSQIRLIDISIDSFAASIDEMDRVIDDGLAEQDGGDDEG